MLKVDKTFIAIILASFMIGGFVYLAIKPGPAAISNNLASATNLKLDSSSSKINECGANNNVVVAKVIDGDTVIVEGGWHVRLLGIDADEKNDSCYDTAKNRLEELILNKRVSLVKDVTDVDQYNRCLRYVFLAEANIGEQLAKEGQVVARFYEPNVKYRKEIADAEKYAIDNKLGCKWSVNQ